MRTYLIELRADFQDEEKYEILLQIAREKAKDLLAASLLLKDKREPQIAFQTGDMFSKNEDMELITAADLDGGE